MPDYRVYVVGHDGHFTRAEDIACADDHEAMEKAKQFVDGRDIELWSGSRFIAKIEAEQPDTGKSR